MGFSGEFTKPIGLKMNVNISYNCNDRHIDKNPKKTAIICRRPKKDFKHISYQELLKEVSKLSNGLKR